MEKYGGDFCQIKTLDFSIFTHFYLIGMLRVQQSAFYETKINVFMNYVMFGFLIFIFIFAEYKIHLKEERAKNNREIFLLFNFAP